MRTQNSKRKTQNHPLSFPLGAGGSVLVLVVVALVILAALGVGLLTVAYGVRHKAIMLRNEAAAMLAAEAGYEKAIFWMGQQKDMLSALQSAAPGTTGVLNFPDGDCDYQIRLFTFAGSRPIYRVISNGHSSKFNRTVDVLVLQAASGWDMGMSRILCGGTSTMEVYFASSEIIDLPLHINNLHDNPDYMDIYILGSPQFLQSVAMGESRYTTGGSDKYASVMGLFGSGIYFDQPESRVTDEATIQTKVDRFKNSTKDEYKFTPAATAPVGSPHAAVQLEFFVDPADNIGKVRVTDNCTVLGYQRNSDSRTLDFKIEPDSDGKRSERYDIYAYHFMPVTGPRNTIPIEQTYVSQSFGGVESEPGGQIFVDGSVIIGGDANAYSGDQVVKGRVTVIATGNIWVADSVVVDGPHDANGKPTMDNPNVLGLIAQGVIKVVDPGISDYPTGGANNYPGPPQEPNGFKYVPIGRSDGAAQYDRHLPDPMVVEAALTVGGGGWGAENVQWYGYGGRKEESGPQDNLVIRGTIAEAARGVVGLIGADGFLKHYYADERLLEGVLPGDVWLRGKYIPAPAGWHDYRPGD
jgi:type II secretory pathway pseudopilin PulG